MDVARIISELRLELGDIQQAILSLEQFDRPGVAETAAQSTTELRIVRGPDADSQCDSLAVRR